MSEGSRAYVEHLREEWGLSSDGRSWEEWLESEVIELREQIQFWSYCTDAGMRRTCPERCDELGDFMISLGIAPYSILDKGPRK